jgi:hypothetical protein
LTFMILPCHCALKWAPAALVMRWPSDERYLN